MLSESLLTSRIITDGVECYDRSIRLIKVLFVVFVVMKYFPCFPYLHDSSQPLPLRGGRPGGGQGAFISYS